MVSPKKLEILIRNFYVISRFCVSLYHDSSKSNKKIWNITWLGGDINKREEARHEINCLDATPCLFTGVFSFSEHLTIVCPTELHFVLSTKKKKSTGDETNA
jgi:hypothetical protein